ncbi:MAG: TrkA family potassium uptake protein [Chloroflexi bacterium]|nr:TrkA family potassium uptake protein [Chloroflexota bacterium]
MFTIIVGGGQVGMYLASLLLTEKHQVMIIESRKDRVESLKQALPAEIVMLGNGTDPNVLESAGIHRANVIAVVTGTDETNLAICSLARLEFKVPRIISRVNNPKNAWLYTPEMGVDVALNQAELLGNLIIEEMSLGDMITLLKLRKGLYSLVEEKVAPGSTAHGKSIQELNLPPDCLLAAVIRKGELILPRGDTILQTADEVLAIVNSNELPELAAILGPIKKKNNISMPGTA